MANYLITGYWGEPHVTAENDRGFNAAVFGAGRFVLPVGEQLRAEYLGNNTVRIYDGKLLTGGAMGGIPAGKYVDLLIPEAGQGMHRNDLIVFQYRKDASTLVETGDFIVVPGVETSGIAVDPALDQQDILTDAATADQMPLYRIPVSGAAIGDPVRLFKVAGSLSRARFTPENLLDNSDFTNPVNQRGRSFYPGGSGNGSNTIDRWVRISKLELTVNDDHVLLYNPYTEPDTTFALYQFVRPGVIVAGKTYTMAVKQTDGHLCHCVITAPETTGATEKHPISDCAYLEMSLTSSGMYRFNICVAAGKSCALVWAALYEGEYTEEALSFYVPKGYGAELAECQRYFVRLGLEGTTHIGHAHATSTTSAGGIVSLPCAMVGEPTVTIASGTPVLYKGNTVANITGVSINHMTGNVCYFNIVSSGLTTGEIYVVRLPNAYIDFTAL